MSLLLPLLSLAAIASPSVGYDSHHFETAVLGKTLCGGFIEVPWTLVVDGELCTGTATIVYSGVVDPFTGQCVTTQSSLYPPDQEDMECLPIVLAPVHPSQLDGVPRIPAENLEGLVIGTYEPETDMFTLPPEPDICY